jgi:hypothetical protein
MISQSYPRSLPPSKARATAQALLSRYPELNEHELDKLIEVYGRLKILDIGLLTSDERISAQLEAFNRDHGQRFKMPRSTLIGFLSWPFFLAIGVLAWIFWPTVAA